MVSSGNMSAVEAGVSYLKLTKVFVGFSEYVGLVQKAVCMIVEVGRCGS